MRKQIDSLLEGLSWLPDHAAMVLSVADQAIGRFSVVGVLPVERTNCCSSDLALEFDLGDDDDTSDEFDWVLPGIGGRRPRDRYDGLRDRPRLAIASDRIHKTRTMKIWSTSFGGYGLGQYSLLGDAK